MRSGSPSSRRSRTLVLPLPERVKGGAASKVVAALLARGLVQEVAARGDEPAWREAGDGQRVILVATPAAPEGQRGTDGTVAERAHEARR